MSLMIPNFGSNGSNFDPFGSGGGFGGGGGNGTTINFGPGGVGGCIDTPIGRICGEIPFGGNGGGGNGGGGGGGQTLPFDPLPEPTSPPPAPGPSNGNGNGCPEGTIKFGSQCVDPSAFLPGGQPFTQPAGQGGDFRVPAVRMVKPILPVASMSRPPGHRPNKTGFYRKDPLDGGKVKFIPKGTVWVKSRRRNPLNPRAASRAISRLESAKKATKKISRVSIRKKKCGKC